MRGRMHDHEAGEFGKSASSAAIIGVDGPSIGAASSILVDGIAERERDETPPPPPLSMRSIIVGLLVMFVLGVAGLIAFVSAGALR